MRRFSHPILGLVFFILMSAGVASAQPTLYLVRHAEKVAQWPGGKLDAYHPLSAKGVKTSERIAKYFAKKEIAGVYSSKTTRSLHTALPLAKMKKLKIETTAACSDTAAIDAFLQKMSTSDGVHVLFTHSNIIPYLLIKSGLGEACWRHAGIAKSKQSDWLLISGYDHIWRFRLAPDRSHSCADYAVIKF